MTKEPTRHCDECAHYCLLHATFYADRDKGCDIGHKPSWFAPRSPVDDDWGHKRRCKDFNPLL